MQRYFGICHQIDIFTLKSVVILTRQLGLIARLLWSFCHMLDYPACSPKMSKNTNFMKGWIRQLSLTVEKLKSCKQQDWAKIPVVKVEQLVFPVPRWVNGLIKEKNDTTVGNTSNCVSYRHQNPNLLILTVSIKQKNFFFLVLPVK